MNPPMADTLTAFQKRLHYSCIARASPHESGSLCPLPQPHRRIRVSTGARRKAPDRRSACVVESDSPQRDRCNSLTGISPNSTGRSGKVDWEHSGRTFLYPAGSPSMPRVFWRVFDSPLSCFSICRFKCICQLRPYSNATSETP